MKKRFILILVFLSVLGNLFAAPEISPVLLKERWQAQWISHPTAALKEYGVFHFRKTFELAVKPGKFIIHVSGDNRYKLYVNGNYVCNGPARGDLDHWRFETVDIAEHLQPGKNVIAAVVWNFGKYIPFAQITHETAFIVQGNSDKEQIVNTDESWKIYQNTAFSPMPVDGSTLKTFIVVGPGDIVDASKFPWNWETPEFDDSSWEKPSTLGRGVPYGVRNFSVQWQLVPRPIPLMEDTPQRFNKIVRDNFKVADNFIKGTGVLNFQKNTHFTILIDQGHLTTAYPQLLVSGGKGAKITVTYAEALKDSSGKKGHRDETDGKEIIGYQDVFIPDGSDNRLFTTLWFRTFRYVQLDIETGSDSLRIHNYYSQFTGYPFKEIAKFESNDSTLMDIWDVGWRTARLCAGENYYDCPYYEQLQYVGDTRIQALISLYVSGDDRLMRNAIQHFDDSRMPMGLTASRYPHTIQQIIPTYSLFWIAMVYDYWMHRDDPDFVKTFQPGIKGVLDWFEKRIDDTGMLGPVEWWNFVDWAPEYRSGEPPGVKDGNSAVVTLTFIYNLLLAAQMADEFGEEANAAHYRELAESMKKAVHKHCWDESKGLYADTPKKELFSQHANVMAVLVDMIDKDKEKTFVVKIDTAQSLVQCTFYYRFYLIQAIKKAGLADRYTDMLKPWRNMLDIGLTTFAEKPEPTRSDCHAWSASPNYDFLATVCGIEPGAPGFGSVNVKPHFGTLEWIKGEVPHPMGKIIAELKKEGENGIAGTVRLPAGLSGQLFWQDVVINLNPGINDIRL